jgi:hypothetical protein
VKNILRVKGYNTLKFQQKLNGGLAIQFLFFPFSFSKNNDALFQLVRNKRKSEKEGEIVNENKK